MVHALREARRVMKPEGILVDLRPAIKRCRVGVLRAGGFETIGKARECFDGSRAADRSVAYVLARKLFRQIKRELIECDVVFESRAALREWLGAYTDEDPLPAHERLIERAHAASTRRKGRLAARITLTMRLFVKATAPAHSRSPRQGWCPIVRPSHAVRR